MAKQTTPTPRDKATNKDGRGARRLSLPRSTATSDSGRREGPSLVAFFQESRAELGKVTWPTRQETMNLTLAVIAMTVGIAVFLGLIDTILNYIVNPLIGAS